MSVFLLGRLLPDAAWGDESCSAAGGGGGVEDESIKPSIDADGAGDDGCCWFVSVWLSIIINSARPDRSYIYIRARSYLRQVLFLPSTVIQILRTG